MNRRLNPNRALLLAAALAVTFLAMASARAQQHTATRLGNPATRFAPPLNTPEDLRNTLRSEALRDDMASILRQGGYQGDWSDFYRAAGEAPIIPLKIPTGTRLPAMSTRQNGKPILLRDVLWAGKEPIDAYEFSFASKGRRYRVVTPKPCSNFWIEDQGRETPVARPALQLVTEAPAEASACDPFEVRITVRNTGNTPLTRIQVIDALPAGLQMLDNRTTLTLDVGALPPADARGYKFNVRAAGPGKYENLVRATSAEGANAQAGASTSIRAPVIALECQAPAEVPLRRPFPVCLTLRNTGDAAESRLSLALPVPVGAVFESGTAGANSADGRVTWEMRDVAPGASNQCCAVFVASQPVELSFAATARGACASPAESECSTKVTGVPAILVEVIDLQDPVQVGNDEIYEIRVLSQGSAALNNIKLVCLLPDAQDFVSGSGATRVQAENRKVTMDPVAMLKPKEEVKWRVIAKTLAPGDARFLVELTSDEFPEPIRETEATQQY